MKKRVLFAVVVLRGSGGIESSLLNLLNNLNPEEYDVDLCIIGKYVSDTTKMPNYINIIQGNQILQYCCVPVSELKGRLLPREIVALFITKAVKRIIGYKNILNFCLKTMKNEKVYDVAISYLNDKFLDVFSGGTDDYIMRCTRAKQKIAWIHNDVREHGLTKEICLPKYRDFNYVVNVSQACKEIFDNIVPEYKNKSVVVTNMLDLHGIEYKKSAVNPYDQSKFNLVTVARIENRQKRIDRVVECCELLKRNHVKNIMWTVIGDGEDLDSLIAKVDREEISDYVQFIGRKSNAIPYMQYADIFVQTSDYEAYSMVLIEALSVGCPCLVTNYDSAHNIITDSFNGWLVEKSTESLYNKVVELVQKPQLIDVVRLNCRRSCEELNKRAMTSFLQIVNLENDINEKS